MLVEWNISYIRVYTESFNGKLVYYRCIMFVCCIGTIYINVYILCSCLMLDIVYVFGILCGNESFAEAWIKYDSIWKEMQLFSESKFIHNIFMGTLR